MSNYIWSATQRVKIRANRGNRSINRKNECLVFKATAATNWKNEFV